MNVKTIKEAREALKTKYPTSMTRDEVCEALGVSMATLYRIKLEKIVGTNNGHKTVRFNRDDVAILMFKRSI